MASSTMAKKRARKEKRKSKQKRNKTVAAAAAAAAAAIVVVADATQQTGADHNYSQESTTCYKLDDYNDCEWNKLPFLFKQHCKALDYTIELWEAYKYPDVFSMPWTHLTLEQKKAATLLAFTESNWNKKKKNTPVWIRPKDNRQRTNKAATTKYDSSARIVQELQYMSGFPNKELRNNSPLLSHCLLTMTNLTRGNKDENSDNKKDERKELHGSFLVDEFMVKSEFIKMLEDLIKKLKEGDATAVFTHDSEMAYNCVYGKRKHPKAESKILNKMMKMKNGEKLLAAAARMQPPTL